MKYALSAIAMTVALAATPVLAADAPMVIVDDEAISYATSNWDGVYVGVTGGYYSTGFVDGNVVLGVNFQPAENFLIGIEGGFGGWMEIGNPGNVGLEAYAAARAGFVVDVALIYAVGGVWIDPQNPPPALYGGVGVEFMATEDLSVRLEGRYYPASGVWHGMTGVLWHIN